MPELSSARADNPGLYGAADERHSWKERYRTISRLRARSSLQQRSPTVVTSEPYVRAERRFGADGWMKAGMADGAHIYRSRVPR